MTLFQFIHLFKKGDTRGTIKLLVWILILILGILAIYFLFKRLGLR